MSSNFLHIDRLATLEEIEFLLFNVLDKKESLNWKEVEIQCKEHSLNFTYSFENTVRFLETISVLSIKNKCISKTNLNDVANVSGGPELSLMLLKKLVELIVKNGQISLLINSTVVSREAGAIIIESSAIPKQLSLFRSVLLNLGIADPGDENNNELFVRDYFKDFFISKITADAFAGKKDIPHHSKTKKLFVSYASADEEFKDALKKHLHGLVKSKYIDYWDGEIIPAGKEWDKEIKDKLNQADVIVFLVSADSIASTYISNVEFATALKKHENNEALLVPVIVRHCDFESSQFGKFMFLPKKAKPISAWDNKDAAYVNVVKGLKNLLNIKPDYEKDYSLDN